MPSHAAGVRSPNLHAPRRHRRYPMPGTASSRRRLGNQRGQAVPSISVPNQPQCRVGVRPVSRPGLARHHRPLRTSQSPVRLPSTARRRTRSPSRQYRTPVAIPPAGIRRLQRRTTSGAPRLGRRAGRTGLSLILATVLSRPAVAPGPPSLSDPPSRRRSPGGSGPRRRRHPSNVAKAARVSGLVGLPRS